MDELFNRPPGGTGRRGVYRREPRESVPADGGYGGYGDGDDYYGDGYYGDGYYGYYGYPDDGDDGSAGVREPRHPKPLGPMSDAGALPEPEPPVMIAMPDPRR
ncbi:MAG TPA: hypothetical protein VH969_33770 [Actinophytocola sp.]|uniref:hypothetical protein n=1 Tax=Actinophytocola sp. TaxID=1872138 RepID=UPI002F92C22F